ncbi:MAG: DUF2085 domain-containing protein [Euryarchaeota archaeon]|nr:DUF2085 domain-containing protein [Euryarchaeota archaeon]
MAFRENLFFSKLLFGVFVLSIVWTVSNFVVPYTLPANTIPPPAPGDPGALDGSANIVDNGGVYDSFWLYPRIVYYVGDAQCHQLASRSLFLNGNQMPMDARMESIYVFANFGLLTAMFATPSTSIVQGVVNVLPKSVQAWGRRHLGPVVFAALFVFLGILPVAVDGFVQLLTPYESTNVTRILTGVPTGWVSGILVGIMITSIRQVDVETAALRARPREA